MKLNISVPNDYNSEANNEAAIAECYGGDEEAASGDNGQQFFEVLAAAAKGAGLKFFRPTDFGAEWEGTKKQCIAARESLPIWASVSEIE